MNKERNVEMENNAHTSRELLLIKKKRRRRKKMLIFLTVLLCFLAASGGGFLLWQRSQRAAQEAEMKSRLLFWRELTRSRRGLPGLRRWMTQ